MSALPAGLPWAYVSTAPQVSYALTYDVLGQAWIHMTCTCGDYTKKPCMDPRGRLSHWVAWYAAMHQGCGR